MKKIACLLPLLLLAACGGGSDSTSSTPTPAPAPAVVFSIPASAITSVSAVGAADTVTITLSHQGTLSGQIYATAADSSNILQPAVNVTANSDNTHTLSVSTLATVAAGKYSGTLTLNVCSDSACTLPVTGSPFKLTYTISIIPEWQTFQANAGHTGYVPLSLTTSAFKQRWLWKPPQNYYNYAAPFGVVTGNGMVYLESGTQLIALNEADGSQNWSQNLSLFASTINPPAINGTKLYLMAGQYSGSNLYILDATSGAILNKSSVTSPTSAFMTPTISNGVVYTNWSGSGLAAFDGSTATQKFFTSLPPTDMWTPAVDANNVYAYTAASSSYVNGAYVQTPAQITVIDNASGAIKLALTDPYATPSYYSTSLRTAPVLGTGSVFTTSQYAYGSGGNLNNFNVSAGNWAWTIPGIYTGNPAYANGTIYAINTSPLQLEARAESNGKLLWSWAPLSSTESSFISDVLLTDSHVFVSTNANTYAIDLTTHQYTWIYPMSGKLSLSANGVLYISTSSGWLAAISLK